MTAHAPQPTGPDAGPEVRLPLQIGTTSLWSLGRTALVLVPALALLPASLGLFAVDDGGELVVGGLVVAVLLVVYAGMHARFAIRERSSDVLLSKRGLRIEGGRFHGLWAEWQNVERARCHLEHTHESRLTLWGIFVFLLYLLMRKGRSPLRDVEILRLRLVPRHGEALVVAQAERPIEMQSLRALLESIQTGPWGETSAEDVQRKAHDARERQAHLGIHVVSCPNCGAPVAPGETPTVVCRYCKSTVPVPHETIQRIAASRQVNANRSVSNELVKKLLKQPGAHETNARIMWLAIPMLLAWPIALGALGVRAATETLTSVDVFVLPVVPLLLVGGLFTIVRASLVDRQALRLLTLDFGAQPPLRKGDPHTCRRCGAPLEERPGEVLVSCAYCACDNVLGLDLGRDVAPTAQQAQSLEEAFKERASEARLWSALKVVGIGLLIAGGGGLVLGAGASMAIDDPLYEAEKKPAKSTAAKPSPTAKPGATAAPKAPAASASTKKKGR